MRSYNGRVYFIACLPLNAVKIGFTSQGVRARLAALQTGCPAPLKIFGSFPGSIDDENRLHAAFAPLHIQGEWFRLERKLCDLACYIGETDDRGCFEDALHDVLMQGTWHPESPFTEEEYLQSGTWKPFAELLWQSHGPWSE